MGEYNNLHGWRCKEYVMKVNITKWSRAKKAFAAGVAAVTILTGVVLGFGYQTTQASSCPSNDIMPCGASSRTSFIKKLKANKPSDMNNIYAKYGLPSSQYDEFAKYAKDGKINPNNGNITVNGNVVGRDGLSLGRNPKSASKKVVIDGKTYHQSHIKDLTKYYNDALVLFDAKGNIQTVIMNLCGNPIKVTPDNPNYKCESLKATKVNNTVYKFSSKVSASDGASVSKVVYDFGDGTTHTEKSPSTVVTHTYAKPGTYTAKVTAYIKATFGRGEFPITVTADCKKTIKVEETAKPAIDITKTVDGVEKKEVALNTPFTYQLTVKNTGNVDLTNAVVTDPAPANVQFLTTDKGTITNNVLSYTIPSLKVGESTVITMTAKVTAQVEGNIKNTACVDAVEVPGEKDDCDDAYVNVPPVVPTNPNITITKTVNGVEQTQVAVGEIFTYKVVVKNTGDIDLTNVLVSDTAPEGVTLIGAQVGSIVGNKWTYTIPSLKVGESQEFTMTAKVAVYHEGAMVNTACVNAPEVNPGQPDKDDACDTATVTVPKPEIPVTPEVPVLPNTGAGNIIGIFAGVVFTAAMAHRLMMRRALGKQ